MGRPKKTVPTYGTTIIKGITYYRTRIIDADGKRVSLFAKTPEELTAKKEEATQQIADATFRSANPTVREYSEKWLEMQSANVRVTTLNDYRSIVKIYLHDTIGDMYMAEVTPDDLKLHVMKKASEMSKSVYGKVNMLTKLIFTSAVESNIIEKSPAAKLSAKGGKAKKEKNALTDEQVTILLDAIRGLPPEPFVMIGLYAGLRREEILALQWDCVELDGKAPCIRVRRAWHTEHNRPVISSELKTKAARRDIPIPPQLVECLKPLKEKSTSAYVIPSGTDGGPLSYTQFKRLWTYITVRSTKERTYTRYLPDGKKVKRTVTPELGQRAVHNSTVVYSMDFQVTPHQLRHTYITNLIRSGIDPKTVQYLAGHENSNITMDIYAHVNYNRPEDMADRISRAFQPAKKADAQKGENKPEKG